MADTKKMAIVVHSGTLDKAYPPLMLAAAAAASDMEVDIFFTFWGLNLLKKKGMKRAKLGGAWRLGTGMMKLMIKRTGMATLTELLESIMEFDNVRLWACTSTMEIMMVQKKQLIDGLAGYMGAAGFLDIAADCDIQLFI